MAGIAIAGAGYAVARTDVVYLGAHFQDNSGTAIAKRSGLVEAALHGIKSRGHAFAPGFVQDLAYQVGARGRLLQKVFAAKFRQLALRARGKDRSQVANQN